VAVRIYQLKTLKNEDWASIQATQWDDPDFRKLISIPLIGIFHKGQPLSKD
jgi:hypothetical protein